MTTLTSDSLFENPSQGPCQTALDGDFRHSDGGWYDLHAHYHAGTDSGIAAVLLFADWKRAADLRRDSDRLDILQHHYGLVHESKSQERRANDGRQEGLGYRGYHADGKVKVWGEIWKAVGWNKQIPAGKEVKIIDAKGLVLIVEALYEDGDSQTPQGTGPDLR